MWLVLQGNYPGTNQSAIHSNYNQLYMSGSIHFLIVTHPQISPGQARLTSEFFGNRLPEKKLQLVDMSILSIILSPWAGVSHAHYLLFQLVVVQHPIGKSRMSLLGSEVVIGECVMKRV